MMRLGSIPRPGGRDMDWQLGKILRPEERLELATRVMTQGWLRKQGMKGGMKGFVDVVFRFVFPTFEFCQVV